MGNDNDSSYNNRRSANSVYKLCGDITSYFRLLIDCYFPIYGEIMKEEKIVI